MNVGDPLVSVVVITYNSYVFVVETLESIKRQTYQHIELIISDDGSTDQTVRLCSDWVEANKYRFVRVEIITVEHNTGIPSNCNRGIKACNGEWVKLIAGDDMLLNECIEIYISYLKNNLECKILTSNIVPYLNSFSDDCKIVTKEYNNKSKFFNYAPRDQFLCLLRVHCVNTPTLFVLKDVYISCNYYDESLRLWEDTPFFLTATRRGFKIHYINYESCAYRVHDHSTHLRGHDRLFTHLQIEIASYMLTNYIFYYKGVEKILRCFLWNIILLSEKFKFNNNNFFSKLIYLVVCRPIYFFIKKINSKYI